ncbi:hypothetical protein TRAPUB_3846 [Trametes pubescens]|uniref:Uncharacterized protein n=1 Tax=Trametes pubescens TaxID=154538 RepID=A0A1M2VCW2_TRAPU|nr:hypothetical protein TRAPUB_3846 [Trametes pubescens]
MRDGQGSGPNAVTAQPQQAAKASAWTKTTETRQRRRKRKQGGGANGCRRPTLRRQLEHGGSA